LRGSTWTANEIGRLGAAGAFVGTAVISPDGRRAVASMRGDRFDLWMFDVATGSAPASRWAEQAAFPVWSPDGREVGLRGRAPRRIWVQSAVGSTARARSST